MTLARAQVRAGQHGLGIKRETLGGASAKLRTRWDSRKVSRVSPKDAGRAGGCRNKHSAWDVDHPHFRFENPLVNLEKSEALLLRLLGRIFHALGQTLKPRSVHPVS